MKLILWTLLFPLSGLVSNLAAAQNVDVKQIDAGPEGETTIHIQKGANGQIKPPLPKWEVSDGTADIEGDTSATARDAKAAWKEACEKWKKEFREDNKENKVVNMNCGTADCSGEAGSKVCTSKASYKVKTRVD